jgi:hypothetical protein
MNRNAMCTKLLDAHRCLDHVGDSSPTGVSQGGDFIHIDAQTCHPYLSGLNPDLPVSKITRIPPMYAQRLLSRDLPTARPDDPVGRVLELMDEYKVRQLALVDGDQFAGLVYEDDLLEAEETTPMALLLGQPVFAAPAPVRCGGDDGGGRGGRAAGGEGRGVPRCGEPFGHTFILN